MITWRAGNIGDRCDRLERQIKARFEQERETQNEFEMREASKRKKAQCTVVSLWSIDWSGE